MLKYKKKTHIVQLLIPKIKHSLYHVFLYKTSKSKLQLPTSFYFDGLSQKLIKNFLKYMSKLLI